MIAKTHAQMLLRSIRESKTKEGIIRIQNQPELQLVFSAAAILPASVQGKCLRYTEDVDVVFTKNNNPFLTLETWTMNQNAL